MRPDRHDLKEIANLLKEKKIIPVIEKTYNFDKAIKAFEHLATGRTKGKLLIQIN